MRRIAQLIWLAVLLLASIGCTNEAARSNTPHVQTENQQGTASSDAVSDATGSVEATFDTTFEEDNESGVEGGFDFQLSSLPTIATFDEFFKLADTAARAAQVRGVLFDPRGSDDREWTFRFGGTFGAAVSDSVVVMTVFGSPDIDKLLADLSAEGGTAQEVQVSGVPVPCASFTQDSARGPEIEPSNWLICGQENMTLEVVGKSGVPLDDLSGLASNAVKHAISIGDPTSSDAPQVDVVLDPFGGSVDAFPFDADPFPSQASNIADAATLMQVVDSAATAAGLRVDAFDVSGVSGTTHFYFIGDAVVATGEDFAVVERLGSMDAEAYTASAKSAQSLEPRLVFEPLQVLKNSCYLISTVERTTISCPTSSVSVEVILRGTGELSREDATKSGSAILGQVFGQPIVLGG